MEGIPLPLLEDAAAAAVTRLQEDSPAPTMIPKPTEAYGSGRLFHGGLQPVEEAPEAYSRSRTSAGVYMEDPNASNASKPSNPSFL